MFDHFYDQEAFQKFSDRISTLISKLWPVIIVVIVVVVVVVVVVVFVVVVVVIVIHPLETTLVKEGSWADGK